MLRCLLVLGIAPLAGGCGTMANMAGREHALMGLPTKATRPYGGAANDVRWAREQAGRLAEPEEARYAPVGIALAAYFGLIDLPLSLIGDTLTLPATLSGKDIEPETTANPPNPALHLTAARLGD